MIHPVSVVFVRPAESPYQHNEKNNHAESDDANLYSVGHFEVKVDARSTADDDETWKVEASRHIYSSNWDCS